MRIFGRSTQGTIICLTVLSFLILFPLSTAMAQSGTKAEPGQVKEKTRSMIMDAVKKIRNGSAMMNKAMIMMKQGNPSKKVERMMTEAEQMMKEGEAAVEKGSKMIEKSKAVKGNMKQMMAACRKMMAGSQMMRRGMMKMKNKKDAAQAEKEVTEGHKHVEEAARDMGRVNSKEKAQ